MSREELFAALAASGLPVAYRKWAPAKPPPLPYAVYFRIRSADYYADDANYATKESWCVELYADGRDERAEAAMEEALRSMGAVWSANETGDVEGASMVAYYFEILGG